jgi:NADH-quinone oxidoreductase subunit L
VIAYSTISQIGYMVMGASIAAYGAGLFHLMTHAFFKALLFMGAGSVIGAMAGIQDMDRMGGFRRAMPFTFVTFTVGALALAGFPLTAGFFSKDEIIAFAINRGDWFVALAILGYIGAFLTAFYAFRMVFRVFLAEPVPEARELEAGHIAHGEPINPMTGEPEDTDVGFPGPEHHVAERERPMKAAMGPLALLSIVGGIVAIPGVSDILEKFLEPTFEDSRFHDTAPTTGAEVWGLVAGGVISILGIGLAWWVYVREPGTAARVRERLAWLHRFLVNKWYFDELYEAMFVRPVATIGAFSRRVIETEFVQATIVGGATGIVRVGTSLARSVQTGYLRMYALFLLLGLAGLTLYFLVTSS